MADKNVKPTDEKPLSLKPRKGPKRKQKTTPNLQCIVHNNRNKTDLKIRPLTEYSFRKIKENIELRQSQKDDSDRLDDICRKVPEHFYPHIYGFHRVCLNRFNNVSRLRKRKEPPLENDGDTYRSCKRRRSTRYTPAADAESQPSTYRRQSTEESGVLLPADKCLFCDKKRKERRKKEESLVKCLTPEAAELIQREAGKDPGGDVFRKVHGIDLVAREAHYHPSCRKDFTRTKDRAHGHPSVDVDNSEMAKEEQSAHRKAFEFLAKYVQESIIEGDNVERMSMLREKYLQYMQDNHNNFYNADYRMYKLKAKLIKKFGLQLHFWQPNHRSELVYSSVVLKGQAIESAFVSAASERRRLEEAAMILRRTVRSAHNESNQMPWPPTARFLLSDAIKPPQSLEEFICHLISDKALDRAPVQKQRLSSSLAQDICQAVTNGQWTMPKHLLLGMTLRHLTGSAAIITFINRFGHCTSYSRLLELETAMCKRIESVESVLPPSISAERNIITHMCWDNFDLLEETPSGAGTTHTAHGIVIQEATASDCDTPINLPEDSLPRTKDRSVTYRQQQIEPCFIKGKAEPKLTLTTTKVTNHSVVALAESSDTLWTCTRSLLSKDVQRVPSWAGWVSLTEGYPSEQHQQSTVEYMRPVFAPVTENATVQHILKVSQEATREVGQQYTIVTFDLAVAKKAYALLWEKPQIFKDIIVRLGSFHLVCAYMGALGKSIRGSGFEEILIESGICASGSIAKVITGKHYNRAMRVHKVVFEALERLLLQRYEAVNGPAWTEEAKCILIRLAENPSKETLDEVLSNPSCMECLSNILQFKESVRRGEHGKTPQFWLMYMDRVWLILQFQRATKQNNFDLHLMCLQRMCSLFFAYDHQNYARYTTAYLLSLLNLPHSHPGAEQLLRQNGFSVSRSDVPSSRNAVDITIEQTINRHAKSSAGIVGFSRSLSTYNRWCLTRHERATYVEATMELLDMESPGRTSHKDLRSSQIRQTEDDTCKVIEAIDNFINPFEVDCHSLLYCLSSGAPASQDVEQDLLEAERKGTEAHDKFVQERLIACTKSYHDPIRKQKLKTFANQAKTARVSGKSKKTKEITAERNVFGQLVVLASNHQLNMESVLSYPLGPVPWALATSDGARTTTQKAALLHVLEESAGTTERPLLSTVSYIIDGNALYQAQMNLPNTFEELAATIFDNLPKTQRLDFITDSYWKLSVKSLERAQRGCGKAHLIGGPRTKVPRDWKQFLLNDVNKKQLTNFILEEWKQDKYAPRLHMREVLFVCEKRVIKLHSPDGRITIAEEVRRLYSSHEEADTKMVLHCLDIASHTEDNTTIILRSPDTDVFILLLYFTQDLMHKILFDTGKGDKRRLIDVKKVAEVEGREICNALPAIHAFTGCDTTSAFVKRGKTGPLKLLKSQRHDFLDAFLSLGRSPDVSDHLYEKLEHFVCIMYSRRSATKDVNILRHAKFTERFTPKPGKVLSSYNGVDISLLPPCRDALKMHIRRANYQALIWYEADKADASIPPPDEHGWELKDGQLDYKWTSGELMPRELSDVVVEEQESDTDEEEEEEGMTRDEEEEEREEDELLNLTDIIYEAEELI